MKKILILLLTLLPALPLLAQRGNTLRPEYAAGTVPVVNGRVQFDAACNVPGKSKAQIMEALQAYVQTHLVEGAEQLPQSRITEVTPETGIIATSVEEYMYFKRSNWQTHRVRFYYQLVLTVKDGHFDVMMRNLHYKYDPEVTTGDFDENRRAEDWITDNAALTKGGTKLARVSGKFRTFTIDRKNELFAELAKAAAAQ